MGWKSSSTSIRRSFTIPSNARRLRHATARIVLVAALFAPTVSLAQPAQDPDWPCVQRLVPELVPAQLWSGPVVDDPEPGDLPQGLPGALSSRDVPLPEAEQRLEQWVSALDQGRRDAALAALFDEVLDRINEERASMIAGIKRYAQTQRRLAEKIAGESDALQGYRVDRSAEQQPELAARRSEIDWDRRVFQDRQRMLFYVCDQVVLLDQRAFAVARVMQGHLG